jgi:hypothetical protein
MHKGIFHNFIINLIEGTLVFETSTGVLGVIVGMVFSQYFDVNVVSHNVLYTAMISISIGLLTMSSIIVNLVSAISLNTYRIASAANLVSKTSFASIIALLLSCCIALFLLVFDQSLIRILRYCLTGGWIGLIFGASIRSVLIGMRIITINLQSQFNTNNK